MRFAWLIPVLTASLLALPQSAGAAVLGDASACAAGGPAVKVRLSGLKERRGTLRLALYDGQGWLKKGGSLRKVRVPAGSDPVDVCLAVPRPGAYAVAVHHDIDADKVRDRTDGAGFSRNPKLSLLARPSFGGSRVDVASGVRTIGIQLMYLRGLAIGPARSR